MREMKDSGISWINEIPKNWNTAPLWALYIERKNKNASGEEQNLLSLSYGNIIQKNVHTNKGLLPENFNGYNIIENGDIVLRLTDLQNDKRSLRTGLSKEHGIITSAYVTLKAIQNVSSEYYHYLLHAYDIIKGFYSMGEGVRQNLGYTELSRMRLPVPNIFEQEQIAAYLNNTCLQVTEAIARHQSIIEKLEEYKKAVITKVVTKGLNPDVEMNDSGIGSLGKIPCDWDIKRIKYIAQIKGRIGFRGYTTSDLVTEGDGPITLSPSNLKNGKMDYTKCTYISWDKYNESPEIQVETGDVLMVKTGSSYGKSSYVNNLLMESTINPQLIVMKSDDDLRYLQYCLQTPYLRDLVENTVVGGTIPTMSQEKIADFSVPYPEISIRLEIADYLDDFVYKVDDTIKRHSSLMEKLEEYRKSLIYNAVTGKIDCREAAYEKA